MYKFDYIECKCRKNINSKIYLKLNLIHSKHSPRRKVSAKKKLSTFYQREVMH